MSDPFSLSSSQTAQDRTRYFDGFVDVNSEAQLEAAEHPVGGSRAAR